jgi:hypothetical protein
MALPSNHFSIKRVIVYYFAYAFAPWFSRHPFASRCACSASSQRPSTTFQPTRSVNCSQVTLDAKVMVSDKSREEARRLLSSQLHRITGILVDAAKRRDSLVDKKMSPTSEENGFNAGL